MSAYPKTGGVSVRKDGADDTRKITEMKIEMLRKAMDGAGPSKLGGYASPGDSGRFRSGPKPSLSAKGGLDTKPARTLLSKQAVVDSRVKPAVIAPRAADVLACDNDLPKLGANAAPNLQATVGEQSKETLEVQAFLAGLGLDRYLSIFMDNGFDCMETVELMEESHMRELGIATGHVLKLRKKLEELNPAPVPPPVEAPTVAPAMARSPSGGTGTGTGTSGGLGEGEFDEEAASAGFKDAVRAWRESQAPPVARQPEVPATPQLAPNSFWSKLGGDEVDLVRCSTPMTLPESEKKISCYQCYHQFYPKYAVERCSPLADQSTRKLCSEECANKWMTAMQAKAEAMQQRQEQLAKAQELRELEIAEGKINADSSVTA